MTDRSNFSVQRYTRTSRVGAIAGGILLVALIAGPWWLDRANMRLLVEIFYFLALAQMWNLLAGYGGLVSVGQQAFVGLGGYLLFILAINFGIGPLWTVPLAGLVGGLLACPCRCCGSCCSCLPVTAIPIWTGTDICQGLRGSVRQSRSK